MMKQMKMIPAEFIALSASTMMLTALGIDIMLPAFGAVREHFGLSHDSTETAKIISFFFMVQIAQIIFGALSDRYGRLSIAFLFSEVFQCCWFFLMTEKAEKNIGIFFFAV